MIILIEILKIILYAIYSVFIKSVSYLVSLLILILIIVIVCYLTKLIVSDLKRRVKIYGKHWKVLNDDLTVDKQEFLDEIALVLNDDNDLLNIVIESINETSVIGGALGVLQRDINNLKMVILKYLYDMEEKEKCVR